MSKTAQFIQQNQSWLLSLEKGDFIPRDDCLYYLEIEVDPLLDSSLYNPEIMNLRTTIETFWTNEYGSVPTIRITGGGLRILTDREAVRHHDHLMELDLKKKIRINQKLLGLNRNNLNPEEKEILSAAINSNVTMIGALRAHRKERIRIAIEYGRKVVKLRQSDVK